MSFFREQIVKRATRSNGWRKCRNAHVKKQPYCVVCGTKRGLEVHHKKSFKNRRELELDPDNLVTLCRRCHFSFGHLFYWKAINCEVNNTIIYMRNLISRRKV